MIVAINLLAGVAIGFALALIRLTHAFANLEVDFIDGEGKPSEVQMVALQRQLEGVKPNTLQDILEEAVQPWLKKHGFL